jgi:tight adherence protein C
VTPHVAEALVTALALLTAAAGVRAVSSLGGGRTLRRARSLPGLPAGRPSAPGTRRLRALESAARRLPGTADGLGRRTRQRALAASLPDTADLLTVSLHAGLNVSLALRRAALHAPEPLRSELDRVVGDVALGTPLREALASLADRTGVAELRTLASILAGADRFGSRVAESIERWADDLWTRRRHEVEAAARRAPVKILFPLVFLILPAFLLMTVVPLLLSTLRTLGF